jgi:outer membrane protein TolC
MNRVTRLHRASAKLTVALVLILFCFDRADAQLYRTTDPKNAPNSTTRSGPGIPPSDSAIEERLVALALGAPQFDASGHLIMVANYKVKAAKQSWFNLLTLSANINDQTFAVQPANGAQYVYPKYFFGLVIPVGTIVSKGSEIKAAREEVKIAEDNRATLERTARAEILTKYKTFKNFRAQVVLQSQVVDDIHAAFLQAEKKFKDGSIAIEMYSDASRNYSAEMSKLLNLQLQQDLTQIDIERIIGVRLETVIN